MEIKNKVFLVTGGASGLGKATSELIIREGGKVLIADMNLEAGQKTQNELGTSSYFQQTDVSDEDSAQKSINMAISQFGHLHGLINCAGVAPAEKILGKNGPHGLASYSNVIKINLIGTFNMIRLAAQAMSTNQTDDHGDNGVIISTASVAAFEGQIGQAAYASSKGGIVALTLPIARELARSKIRVMTIAPGIMETPMLLSMPADVQESLGKMVPHPSRLGKPSEFAALVQHIIENSYLNGEVIRLDGAIRMGSK